ncbi:unnamed protein product [Notodromas monacha]|uniref:Inhibitor of growth protein n=1 Tax=Notodromas monacha TaxID=399045 RepID=A0A7R9BDA4_9CRUS|nr:unnamed protein product [Notodromas monacha]CAG0913198.1 unnamed protein product [Notodromas monacha]
MTSFLEKGGFLDHCLDSLNCLPSEIHRSFALLTDLEKRATQAMTTIKTNEAALKEKISSITGEEKKRLMDEILLLYREVHVLSEEKVQLSKQSYELVDKHIRKLDKEITDFDREVIEKCGSLAVFAGLNPEEDLKPGNKGSKPAQGPLSPSGDAKKRGRKRKIVSTEPQTPPKTNEGPATFSSPMSMLRTIASEGGLDMPVDPNEPLYCICNQVSYGEMIGCDNVECSIEWFHFPCMNLTAKPKGKWWCAQCAPKYDPNYKKPASDQH